MFERKPTAVGTMPDAAGEAALKAEAAKLGIKLDDVPYQGTRSQMLQARAQYRKIIDQFRARARTLIDAGREAEAQPVVDAIDAAANIINELSRRIDIQDAFAGQQPRMFADSRDLGARTAAAFADVRETFEAGGRVRFAVPLGPQAAATDPVTTGSGRTIFSDGAGIPTGGVQGIQNALPTRLVPGTTAVEYSRYTGTQGAAAQQAAEGDAKAATRPDHSIITQQALTVAGYAKMSVQAIRDSEELAGAVNRHLARSCAIALDTLLCNGGTNFTGYEALATAYTSLVYSSLVDAVSEGVSTMQTAGFVPDVVVLNPTDWLAVTVAKGTSNDHYLSGSYLGILPMEMRGLRVVLSPSIDAGKALLLDSAHCELLVVDQFRVEAGLVNDDFSKNLVTLRGELRVIPTFRCVGAARFITPKP